MTVSSKRAENTALTSLILSIIFFGITFFVGRWSGFFAVYAVSWFVLSTTLIWFVLVIQFHQRALAEQEKLDMSRLTEGEKTSTIFQGKGGPADVFAVAQSRLGLLEKWFIPILSAVIAVYQAGIGLYLLKTILSGTESEMKQPLLCAVYMTVVAFVSFLLSRYATGMSSQLQWKPLRAGGSAFLGAAVLCFALAVATAMAQFKSFTVVNGINFVIPVLLVILGAETALNVVLDIYRPRLKGQYSRAAFDSRLLGILNEPGGIFRTAAGAIDYQFGFKVSQTWFYQLLEKAIVPLLLFAAIVLYSLSAVVVVGPNEQAIIEHFGNPVNDSNNVRIVGPGLAFKMPWPIDVAYKYPTNKISEMSIGYVPKIDPKTKEEVREPLLWGKAHYEKEHRLLVASKPSGEGSGAGAVPVSLVMAAIPVQYKVKDLYSFIYGHTDTEKLLEDICYRELTRFAAGAKIEVDETAESTAGDNQSLLGAGRSEASLILTERIQSAADQEKLGIEIVFVGLQGIHPPPEVAADYEQVIGSVQKKQALILDAQGVRNSELSALAGSVKEANELYVLAGDYQKAKEENQLKEAESLGENLDAAFAHAGGDIFRTLRQARSYAFERATLAKATGERFAGQIQAYRSAKEIYKHQQRLAALEESLEKVRKYVVVADSNDTQVFTVDVQEKLTPGLYDITGLEESGKK